MDKKEINYIKFMIGSFSETISRIQYQTYAISRDFARLEKYLENAQRELKEREKRG